MANKITFKNAILLSFSRTGKTTMAKFASLFDAGVIKAMDWSEVADKITSAKPEGELNATHLELVPNEKELRAHAIDLDISNTSSFQTVRLELDGLKGKGHKTELRFTVESAADNAAQTLEAYMVAMGEGKGRLNISYRKQESLEYEATEEQREATSEEND